MGNVFAASAPEPPKMSLSPPPLVPAPPDPAKESQQSSSSDKNPGTYEELHQQCKGLFPQNFEGAKLIITKGLSSYFQISHTLSMSGVQPSTSGYRFGATYVGSKQLSPTEVFPVFVGDIDPSGNLNANIIHAFSNNVRAKLVSQFQESKCVALQGTVDYKGEDFTASSTLGNIDILNNSGIILGQYLQRVNSRLALGAELVYQYGRQVPGSEFTVFSLAGRISGDNWQATGNLCPAAMAAHACYHHKINEQLQVAAEIESSLVSKESVGTVGYQIDIPSSHVTFKGQLDTNWSIGATMEKKLEPLPFTFALSGMANYANFKKPQYRFGVGLIIG